LVPKKLLQYRSSYLSDKYHDSLDNHPASVNHAQTVKMKVLDYGRKRHATSVLQFYSQI
jgi:hypothetical protein